MDTQPRDQVPPAPASIPSPRGRGLRPIHILIAALIVASFVGTFYLLGDDARKEQIKRIIEQPGGLLVLFAVSALSNATLILPVPGLTITSLAGAVADPLTVGVVAGVGQTIGELTGYLAGYSGRALIEDNPRYNTLSKWMRRFGPLTLFVLALIPNPLFDVAGIIAGALRMSLWLYLLAAGLGKVIKNIAFAYGAASVFDWLLRILGGS
jgi:uncharacterized membrane protein YdjX (TVP38/TMEM64 family)